jgi:hypothetical protein
MTPCTTLVQVIGKKIPGVINVVSVKLTHRNNTTYVIQTSHTTDITIQASETGIILYAYATLEKI